MKVTLHLYLFLRQYLSSFSHENLKSLKSNFESKDPGYSWKLSVNFEGLKDDAVHRNLELNVILESLNAIYEYKR